MMKLQILTLLYSSILLAIPLNASWAEPKSIDYTILDTKAHNSSSFTQGLILNQNTLIETSGLYNQSFITEYDAASGVEKQRIRFPSFIFAEGLTLFNKQLFVLSWRAHKAFVLNPTNFDLIKTFDYSGEGWGITHNNSLLITSDGSNKIVFRNPLDFSATKTITVHNGKKRYSLLNELEYAHNLIWANVWQSDTILAINPETGQVEGTVDLSKLTQQNSSRPGESVLNGIAYDSQQNAFWITGKFWPQRYLIRFSWPTVAPPKILEQ